LPYERLLSGTRFKKAGRQKGGKGKTEAHWKYFGGLRRDPFSGDARAYPK
jgi:hypothetical protein